MAVKTLQEWQNELRGVLLRYKQEFLKIGELLYKAEKELPLEQYWRLEEFVASFDLRSSDMKLAKAAYRNTLPEDVADEGPRINHELVFTGCKSNKVLNMGKREQERLLSNEKFSVLMPNGQPDVPKTWREMTPEQRNLLISKGGRILPIEEQTTGRQIKIKTVEVPLGSIKQTGSSFSFISRDGKVRLVVGADHLKKMLTKIGYVEKPHILS